MSHAMSVVGAARLAASGRVRATQPIENGRSAIIFVDPKGATQWATLDHETQNALVIPLPDQVSEADREVTVIELANWHIEQAKLRLRERAARKDGAKSKAA